MGSNVTFNMNGMSGQGYLASPDSGSGPAVIVIQEWWGLVGHITDIVERFAAQGFVAFAPDLYHGQAAAEPDLAKKLMMELQLDLAGKEISNAAQYLLSLSQVSSKHVGAIGFCMGGSLAIWSGTLSDSISATVGFYPGSSWERHAPKWNNYQGKECMIHCAEGDGTSAAPGIQEALTKINAAGGVAQVFDYANTQHAFFNNDRPEVYNAQAAELAWSRTLEFFKEKLS